MSDDFDSVRDETGDAPWLAHRDELLDRVVHRGRALQWRRRAGLASVLLVILAVPFAAVAATSGAQSVPVLSWVTGDDHKSAAATTTTTSPPRPVVHPRPTVPPTDATTTTTIACHDSFDPACGPFSWVPERPLFNPLPVEITVSPTEATLGTEQVFSVRVADSPLDGATLDFGDGSSQTLDSLLGIVPRDECPSKTTDRWVATGAWTWSPPALRAPIEVRHTFSAPGSYNASISIVPGSKCGLSAFDGGDATTTVTVVDTPGTSSSSTTTTTLGP